MSSVDQIFADYNYYRNMTAHVQKRKQQNPHLRDLKLTAERQEIIESFLTWSKEKEVNPRLWIYSLFSVRRWFFPPRLEKAHLQSEKHYPKYKNLSRWKVYKQRLAAEQGVEDYDDVDNPERYDPNRDISPGVEKLKISYVQTEQNPQKCFDDFENTMGYHPNSEVCLFCSLRFGCHDRLVGSVPFDIMALRNGLIKSSTARSQALFAAMKSKSKSRKPVDG